MGANFSVSNLKKAYAQRRVKTPLTTFLKGPFMAMENPDASPEPNKTSRIKTFESKDEWEVYMNASEKSNKLVVIYFRITSCGPCQWFESTIEEYADIFKDVDFIKINVDELPNVAEEFNATEYAVHSVPTFVLMKNGEELDVEVRVDYLHEKIGLYRK